ncbi:hypothetical protein Golax_023975 [Gossypium laxum]|uniref:Uncharacterized protein n=1 Tax=Gossypium laxum TaxID=34288 RepID=A0A7J8ZAP6_9ROSI|nr:hypothetical protein [Gossypium laxum]
MQSYEYNLRKHNKRKATA